MSFDPAALPDVSRLTVGIVGGTGDQGRGLAYRLARAGQRVRIGSRSVERGEQVAAELATQLAIQPGPQPEPQPEPQPGVGADALSGGDNFYACGADIVIVAVPWTGHAAIVADLAAALSGRIVVDCVNPLGFDKNGPYALAVPEGSAAQQAATLLPESTVCAAFHHVSAALLADPAVARIELDVLVLGDDRAAVELVQALAGRIEGVRGIAAGRLRNAGQVEALTANLIAVNKRYKAHAGLRVTDL